jgi:hypothetical protein
VPIISGLLARCCFGYRRLQDTGFAAPEYDVTGASALGLSDEEVGHIAVIACRLDFG